MDSKNSLVKNSVAQPSPIIAAKDSLSGRPAPEILAAMAVALQAGERFVITAHVGPDGDALGSGVGLALALREMGKDARVVSAQVPPQKYRALLPQGVLDVISASHLAASSDAVDWWIVVDTNEPSRIGEYEPIFFAKGHRLLCLDHHRSHQAGRFDMELVVPEAPATGNLVLALIDRLGVALTPGIAEALWIAIATDTGWFRFANAVPWAFLDAARLVEHSFDVERLYEKIYVELSPERARLTGVALEKVREEIDGALVWSCISLADRGDTPLGELDGVIDQLKAVEGARIAALIVELEPGAYKVSLRAKGGSEVEGIARSFHGGGHAKAAGYRFRGSLENLVKQLCEAVSKRMRSGDRAQ